MLLKAKAAKCGFFSNQSVLFYAAAKQRIQTLQFIRRKVADGDLAFFRGAGKFHLGAQSLLKLLLRTA